MDIKLCDSDSCTGCAACANICPKGCIQMLQDKEGFLHPEIIRDLCIGCHKCESACPILTPLQVERNAPDVYAGWTLDKAIRMKSSSGGAFSALSQKKLDAGGVVFGARFDENHRLYHTLAKSNLDIQYMRGSKYVQSEIGMIYKVVKKYLSDAIPVLFVGTPCQIAGLYGFLGSAKENLITCELLCHGVPSPTFLKNYIDSFQKEEKFICDNISFRNLDGWSKSTKFQEGNTVKKPSYEMDYYSRAFFKNMSLRECCYNCKFAKLPRIADITIGDFWGIGEKIPFEYNMDKGVSLIFVNSKIGKMFFKDFGDYMFLQERDLDEALESNPCISKPTKKPIERNLFYKDYKTMHLSAFIKKYGLGLPASIKLKIEIKKKLSGFIKRKS